jgi:hypothetical protein
LFTIAALWPSLRQLIVHYNHATRIHPRPIAVVILEIDNHYRPSLSSPPAAKSNAGQTLVPLVTALGGRSAIETFSRADAYRLVPPGCAVTISPGLHPGLLAPVGWELSEGARDELRQGLFRVRPNARHKDAALPVQQLRKLQFWLGARSVQNASLRACVLGQGIVLPDRNLTPGAVNPAVRQETIGRTICVNGWRTHARPPVAYTNALRLTQMAEYGDPGPPSAYEEDHFIPLELGGAPRNAKNSWPEPWTEDRRTDRLETQLMTKVCHGTTTLAKARATIRKYKYTHG